ncbi:hypothetical protein GCM10018952_23190 [Streptosporangium vulgare]
MLGAQDLAVPDEVELEARRSRVDGEHRRISGSHPPGVPGGAWDKRHPVADPSFAPPGGRPGASAEVRSTATTWGDDIPDRMAGTGRGVRSTSFLTVDVSQSLVELS